MHMYINSTLHNVLTITMEFITNEKGNKSLVWNGSRFTVNCNRNIYWRCRKRSCPARVTTQGSELLARTNGHNHPVDPTEVLFATDDNLHHLSTLDATYVVGTFQVCPSLFTVTHHSFVHGY